MRSTYRTLAYLIALGVAIQAASIAYAMFTVGHALFEDNKTIDKDTDIGGAGFAMHAIGGQLVIPLLAIILVVIALIVRFPGAVNWSLYVLVATVVQVLLGIAGDGLPALGLLHGLNALLLFSLAVMAAHRVAAASGTPSARSHRERV